MIFNVLVDAVLLIWASVVAEEEGDAAPEGFGRYFQRLVAYFYHDYFLITYIGAERLQRAVNFLAEIFYRVGIQKNVGEMVSIARQTCHVIGVNFVQAYGRRKMI